MSNAPATSSAPQPPKAKPPLERRTWILEYLRLNASPAVDVLDSDFVDAYIEATGVSFTPTSIGAHRCSALGSDLSQLFAEGKLDRYTVSLKGDAWMPGFPRWVYSYELKVALP